jgi:thiosulfate/3-mercaptopyruvate sulfurtransferase
VKNYDGSWLEWGNAVRVPIATGASPGGAEAPASASDAAAHAS